MALLRRLAATQLSLGQLARCHSRTRFQGKPKRPGAPRDRYDSGNYRKVITRGCELAFEVPVDLRKISREL